MQRQYKTNSASAWAFSAYAVVSLVCLYVSIVPLGGIDFWMQAKIGSLILQAKEIPHTLLFPFTEVAEQRFNAHEWLTSIFFHELLSTVGSSGIPVFTGILGLVYFLLCTRLGAIRAQSNSATALFGGILAIATENYRHTLRPELISLILMGGYWICLESYFLRPGLLWSLMSVLLTIAWANVHGSFILAPILVSLYLVGWQVENMRRARRLQLFVDKKSRAIGYLCLAIWLSCLVTPFGLDLVKFVVGFGNEAGNGFGLLEWTPTFDGRNLHSAGLWLAAVVWALTLAVIAINIKKVSAIDLLIFLFFTYLAVKAIRFPIYLGMVATFIVCKYLPETFIFANWEKYLNKFSIALALLACGASLAFGNASGQRPSSAGMWKLSDQMTLVLSDPQYQGNVFNSMELGAELTYLAYPRLRPSIDCRVDSYGLDYVMFQKELLKNDALLTEFLDRYGVRYLLLERARINQLNAAGVWKKERWELIYQDGLAAFMRRVDAD